VGEKYHGIRQEKSVIASAAKQSTKLIRVLFVKQKKIKRYISHFCHLNERNCAKIWQIASLRSQRHINLRF
jgi:hypothetical protein